MFPAVVLLLCVLQLTLISNRKSVMVRVHINLGSRLSIFHFNCSIAPSINPIIDTRSDLLSILSIIPKMQSLPLFRAISPSIYSISSSSLYSSSYAGSGNRSIQSKITQGRYGAEYTTIQLWNVLYQRAWMLLTPVYSVLEVMEGVPQRCPRPLCKLRLQVISIRSRHFNYYTCWLNDWWMAGAIGGRLLSEIPAPTQLNLVEVFRAYEMSREAIMSSVTNQH